MTGVIHSLMGAVMGFVRSEADPEWGYFFPACVPRGVDSGKPSAADPKGRGTNICWEKNPLQARDRSHNDCFHNK